MSKDFLRASKVVLFLSGVFYVGSGLGLLFAPEWFYDNLAKFPPYNRHFLGDAGIFAGFIGLVFFVAWRDPQRYRNIIGLGAFISLLHALNHGYDAVIAEVDFVGWFDATTSTIPLLIFAGILITIYWGLGRKPT